MIARKPVRRPRAVIFDMDGLMLDTERIAARAFDEAVAATGIACDPEVARRMIGRNERDSRALLVEHHGEHFPIERLFRATRDAYEAIVAREGIVQKQGLAALLDWLDGQAIVRAVATSTRRQRAVAKLGAVGLLARFEALVGGDEIERGKPAPDIFLAAASRVAIAPEACIVLEDSEPGIHAALAADMCAIMVPDLHPPSPALLALDPLVLPCLDDVREYLAALPA